VKAGKSEGLNNFNVMEISIGRRKKDYWLKGEKIDTISTRKKGNDKHVQRNNLR